MWFDCVIIDQICLDGVLRTHHLRASHGAKLATESLEQLDLDHAVHNVKDIGPLRLYGESEIDARVIEAKLKHLVTHDDGQLLLHLDPSAWARRG